MITTKKLNLPRYDEIRSEAVRTIIDQLGITKAAFFIRESMFQKTDYLQLKDVLFGNKTASELYSEIKKSKL